MHRLPFEPLNLSGNNYYYTAVIIILFLFIPLLLLYTYYYIKYYKNTARDWLFAMWAVATTLRQSFHYNFKVCVLWRDRWIRQCEARRNGRLQRWEKEEAKNRLRRKMPWNYRAAPMVVKDLGWEFSNLRKRHECDYVKFGPPISRNLVADEDFLCWESQSIAAQKFLEWARLWQRVCLHRPWWC